MKPNKIWEKIAVQKPECNEIQPTSCNQEHFGRWQNIDQSHLPVSTNTTNNIRDVNQKNQTLLIDSTNRTVDSCVTKKRSSS